MVAAMNGQTYFFSLAYMPGEMKSQTWYRMKGEAMIAPPTNEVLR